MPEHLSASTRIHLIADELHVPSAIIRDAIDTGIITEVGYGGEHVIDALGCVRVAQQYRASLTYTNVMKEI
jgi:hypothetical protein